MKILMIAPEPVFEPRGTPLSVVGRLKALSDMGHQIDLVTYPIGEDVQFPGVRFLRAPAVPGIRKIKIGPSAAKLPLDLSLLWASVRQLFRGKYDLIHTHEEAGFWGTILARLWCLPHLYDMHSSLPQQMTNFKFTQSKAIIRFFDMLERWVIRHADAVITICPDLYNHVRSAYGRESILIENVVDYDLLFGEKDSAAEIRRDLSLAGKRVALYAGTFEHYQGIDLLIESAERIRPEAKDLVWLLVGGRPDQVEKYKALVQSKGLSDIVRFVGQVPPRDVTSYIRCSDVLTSPRTAGTNTPLKIYSYLRSGVPVVATRLWTHTQVLDDSVSILAAPDPESFGRAVLSALRDPKKSQAVIRRAADLSRERYGYDAYKTKLTWTYDLARGNA